MENERINTQSNLDNILDKVQNEMKNWTAVSEGDFVLKDRIGKIIGRDCSNTPHIAMISSKNQMKRTY